MSSIAVGIAEWRLARAPDKLVTYGLGSCVAIVLDARAAGVASMAHIMLPLAYTGEGNETPGKFADSAIGAMVREMESLDLGPGKIVAKIAGGADMFAGQFKGAGRRIGARNILATRKTLDDFGIPLVAQDVGGSAGRTVEFLLDSGIMVVKTLRGGVKRI